MLAIITLYGFIQSTWMGSCSGVFYSQPTSQQPWSRLKIISLKSDYAEKKPENRTDTINQISSSCVTSWAHHV